MPKSKKRHKKEPSWLKLLMSDIKEIRSFNGGIVFKNGKQYHIGINEMDPPYSDAPEASNIGMGGTKII
jgi:hypothetical protein